MRRCLLLQCCLKVDHQFVVWCGVVWCGVVWCGVVVVVCFCCVRFSFFSAMPRDWLVRTSLKWPVLCRVGCKTLTEPYRIHTTPQLFPEPPGWASARRELVDFMVQGKINRGRHTDHPDGCHSIRTKQCPPPSSPHFYRPDALPAAQPTVSKHWRQFDLVA